MTSPLAALARTSLLVRRDFYPSLSDEQIVRALTGCRVKLVIDARDASSRSGQTALVATFVWIAELGCEILLDVPEVPLAGPQPPLTGDGLRSALLHLGSDLITPARVDEGRATDISITFGATGLGTGTSTHKWRLHGDSFTTTLEHGSAPGSPWSGALPFGALLGGAAVTAEVFRHVIRGLADSYSVTPPAEHHLASPATVALSVPPLALPVDGWPLGALDFVSAGAITNSAMFALLRLPDAAGQLRVFDDDTFETSNLNRYPLARASQVGGPKVDAFAELATGALSITGLPIRLEPGQMHKVGPLAPLVAVGVDHVPSRWVAQRHAPDWVGVGATSHFEVLVSGHERGAPCAGCLHPRDDDDRRDIPTVSFVSGLAGTLLAHRIAARVAGTRLAAPATLGAAFNLGGSTPIRGLLVPPRQDCPVRCPACLRSEAAEEELAALAGNGPSRAQGSKTSSQS